MIKRIIKLFFDALFVTRPIILIPVWGFYFFGYYRSCLQSGSASLKTLSICSIDFPVLLYFHDKSMFPILCMFTLLMASSFIVNQIRDIQTDSLNEGIPIIAKGGYPVKMAVIETVVFALIPLIYALSKGWDISFFFFSAFVITLVYNFKPFYFSGRPFLDFLSNGIGFGLIAFGLGWISVNSSISFDKKAYIIEALPYFFAMASGSIGSTIPDEKGDRNTGKITTVIYLGKFQANGISILFLFFSLLVALWNKDGIMIFTSLVSLPFFIRYQYTQNIKDGIFAFQFCGGLMMVLVVIIFPWFFLLAFPVALGTKLYFKLRHGISYPKMG